MYKKILHAILPFLLLFSSCEKKAGDDLSISLPFTSASGVEGGLILTVAAPDWQVSSDADWLSFKPTAGRGKMHILMSYEKNSSGADRNARIVLLSKSGGFVEEQFTQKAFSGTGAQEGGQNGGGQGGQEGGGQGGGNPGGETPQMSVTVISGAASSITVSSAVISASYSGANAAVREAGVEWGTTSSLGSAAQYGAALSGESGSFSVSLEALGDGVTYYYRAYVTLQNGDDIKTFYGRITSFVTVKESDKPALAAAWYELPEMNVARSGDYLVNATDGSQYYAYHMCSGGEKGPGGTTARNYTVCYSATHHCPLWVAAPRHHMYVGSSGRNDSYRVDPDIPSSVQSRSTATGGGCNKGHMLGSAERTSSVATNRDVFFYTNIAPQLSTGFNTGGGGWNLLEDWVDKQVCADTLYEVVGCYFDSYTDSYGNRTEPATISFGGRDDVSMPTMFYYVLLRTKNGSTGKALKDCRSDELKCAAFVRAHTNALKGQNVTSAEMMSVSQLEAITGIKYFPNVPAAPKASVSASDWGL